MISGEVMLFDSWAEFSKFGKDHKISADQFDVKAVNYRNGLPDNTGAFIITKL